MLGGCFQECALAKKPVESGARVKPLHSCDRLPLTGTRRGAGHRPPHRRDPAARAGAGRGVWGGQSRNGERRGCGTFPKPIGSRGRLSDRSL